MSKTTAPRVRAVNLYTVEQDGQPVAQAEAISQAEAVALWVASQQQPALAARLSTPREARMLAHLPLLSRGAPAAWPERDPRVPDMFDDVYVPAAPVSPVVGAVVDMGGFRCDGRFPAVADHVEDVLAMVAAHEISDAEFMAAVSNMPTLDDAVALFSEPAPTVDDPDPQWLDADGVVAREVLAFNTGRDIGKRGLKRFSAEMLEADAAVLRNVRSEQDAGNIHAELLRGFDAGRDECGNAPTIPPKGAGKVEAKYRNPETGESWSGRGLKPRWLVVALEAGRTLDEFLIDGAQV